MKTNEKSTPASQEDPFSLEFLTVAFASSLSQVLNAGVRKLRSDPGPKPLASNVFIYIKSPKYRFAIHIQYILTILR